MSVHQNRVAPWEDVVLRTIAIYKFAKAALFTALGIGFLHLIHRNVADLLHNYVIDPMHFDPENRLIKAILDSAERLTTHKIEFISFGALIYAAVFATEGIGLYLRKHWAEYMVLFSTGLLLPLEFWEIYLKLAWWKFGVVVGNLAILLYLIHRLWLDAHPRLEDDDGKVGGRSELRGPGPNASRSSGARGRIITKVP